MKSLWIALLIFGTAWSVPVSAQVVHDPATVPPLRRSLPTGMDYLESGLYWMQDWWGVGWHQDPAGLVSEMEERMADLFDLGYMALQVGGPRYAERNILSRSHFQHRVRDRLFEELARHMGWFSDRMPRVYPLIPVWRGPYRVSMGGVLDHYAGPRLHLQFHMAYSLQGWRVYDVSSNGVSLLGSIRRDFLAGDL